MVRIFLVALWAVATPLLANDARVAPASQLVIPVVGSLPGAHGTFYRTDVVIESFKNQPQRIRFTFLPQAGSGATAIERERTFSAAWTEDILPTMLGGSGMGTLIVSGIQSDGTPDPTARLIVTARIWTGQADGGAGTYSQTISAIPLESIATTGQIIHGMRGDPQYRVNVGVVNLEETEQKFLIRYHPRLPGPAKTVRVTVPARSMQQVPLPDAQGGAQEVSVAIDGVIDFDAPAKRWTAYGSTVDNVTGDAWTVIGFNNPELLFFFPEK